jgi:predicted transcriptional regulator
MKQLDLYLKDIERHIEGVIKADDEEFIVQEVEEYVVTKEIEKHLSSFYSDYIKKDYNESAWISGFFGCGKSHLLKMLSLVLENKEINGKKCGALFVDKIKDDFELNANIKKAIEIPSRTILFNIAQKADGIGNINNADPILAVFLKVFNEFQGYYGQSPAIAEVERHLDESGEYERFQELFHAKTGKDWLISRKHILLNRNDFAKAYAELMNISEEDAKRNFDEVRSNFKLDLIGLVEIIKAYIKKQPKNFRLIFCVDEVGQFIADDVRLMLSLQTLAETLSVSCKGQAFLFVTSQNDLVATIGDLNANQSHDFSRIQGRFAIKIPLTSANADEVIQKRLLDKNETGIKVLGKAYEKEKNNLRTLFEFGDNSKQYTFYKDQQHFCNAYPFIPYQFDLLQASIRSLSEHNAFMGRHQSVGERSMLGVFQQVAKVNAKNEVGTVVTYDQMFDGIRDILQSNIQADIIQGERSLQNDLAVSALKALFLVKYVKGFQSTVKNITILLLPSLEVDLGGFQKKVQEALNLLYNQTYINKIGENYEFLTNQEKDVENEIKATEIDPKASGDLLAEILFNEILRDSKVKLDSSNQVYEFGKKVDDNLMGKERDFYVNFITPLNVNSIATANVAMKSVGNTELIVALGDDARLLDELRLIEKTKKYIQTTTSPNLDPTKQRILQEKGQQNADRKRNLINSIKDLIADAKMYLNGSHLDSISSKEPKNKITAGVQQLIKVTYPSLSMLTADFSEDDIKKIIDKRDDVLFKDSLSPVEQEVLDRINRNKANHDRTTTKALLDHFSARPYGWYQAAVLCLMAKLYKRNKISLKKDGNTLDDRGVLDVLNSNREYANTIIEPDEEISNTQVKKLKDFHQEYFSEGNLGNEPKDISKLFKQRLTTELKDLNEIYSMRGVFPFLEQISEAILKVKNVAEKEHPYFFNALDSFKEEMLDDKESFLDPIKKFMGGQQKSIFENVLHFLQSDNANFDYINKNGIVQLQKVKESKAPYKGNLMQEAKQVIDAVKAEVLEKIKQERDLANAEILKDIEKIQAYSDYSRLDKINQDEILKPFTESICNINNEKFIGNIRAKLSDIQNRIFPDQLNRMSAIANPLDEKGSESARSEVTYVQTKNIKVKYNKLSLETEADVEAYVNELREEYIKIIKANKRISL